MTQNNQIKSTANVLTPHMKHSWNSEPQNSGKSEPQNIE
jgi:hypothetical protein